MTNPNPGQQPNPGNPGAGAEHPATAVAAPWSGAQDVWNVGEGDKAQPWFNTIPEEPVRELIKTKAYKNPAELAMAYHNLNKSFNDPNRLSIPTDPKDQKAWDAFYTKLGRPETPEKYDIKIKEGTTPNPAMLDFGKKLFHNLGASPEKAQAMYDQWEGFMGEQFAAQAKQEEKDNSDALAELSTRWGADLEQNKAAGLRVAKALGLPDATMAKIEGNIGAAGLVELLALIGRKSDEGSFKGGGGGDPSNPANMSPEQAEAAIKVKQADTVFMAKYNDAKHPEHQTALKEMEALFARTTPKK